MSNLLKSTSQGSTRKDYLCWQMQDRKTLSVHNTTIQSDDEPYTKENTYTFLDFRGCRF